MTAYAIIIGIDAYANTDWNLTGAVNDAVDFARWATSAGDVAPGNLYLHLSPRDATSPFDGGPPLSWKTAGTDALRATLKLFYKDQIAQSADRLWVFYAGHGVMPPGEGPSVAPLIVPSDVTNLASYAADRDALSLEYFRMDMEDKRPREQLYFIDACRNLYTPTDGSFWWASRMFTKQGENAATQVVFMATAAWQNAKEARGRGLFGRALTAGLRGLGPTLSRPQTPTERHLRLRFGDLKGFVRTVVPIAARTELLLDEGEVQVPEPYTRRGGEDLVLARFDKDALPRVKITPVVQPDPARTNGLIEFYYFNEDNKEWKLSDKNPPPQGKPIPDPADFEIPGGEKFIQISSPGFETTILNVWAYAPKKYPVKLKEKVPDLEMMGRVGTSTAIMLTCNDKQAVLSIVDVNGKEVSSHAGGYLTSDVTPGTYRISAVLSETERATDTLIVEAGQTVSRELEIPGRAAAPAMAKALNDQGVPSHDGRYAASEHFGWIADGRLSTLLASIAWAARWPLDGTFMKLRDMFSDVFVPVVPPDQTMLQVLFGDSAADPTLLQDTRVWLDHADGTPRSPEPLALDTIPKLPMARHVALPAAAGAYQLRVEIPGFASAAYPINLIKGFATVIVITREREDLIEVQQHFNPLDPMMPSRPALMHANPVDVRYVAMAWRALAQKAQLLPHEYEHLLHGKWSNPMLAIIAGYRMLGTPSADRFSGRRDAQAISEGYALANMLRYFDDLPDVHVLAALYDDARRDVHLMNAIARGIPIVVDGFTVLHQWLLERAGAADLPPPVLLQPLLPGSALTAFTPRTASVLGENIVLPSGHMVPQRKDHDRVVDVSNTVAEIKATNGELVCSAVLASRQIAVCPLKFARRIASRQGDQWTAPEGVLCLGGRTARIVSMRTALLPPFPIGADIAESWPVLLQLDKPLEFRAPPIVCSVPEVGQAIAVVGTARRDIAMPEALAKHFRSQEYVLHIAVGSLTEVTEVVHVSDSFGASGVEGGGCFDLETGALVGMYIGSTWTGDRKRSVAISATWIAHATKEMEPAPEALGVEEEAPTPHRITDAATMRDVILAPTAWQELRFYAGGAGDISVAVTTKTAIEVELELARPDGVVVARVAPTAQTIGAKYVARAVDLDATLPWTLRARGAAPVAARMHAQFPAEITSISLAKLNAALKTVLAEAAISVTLNNNVLDVSVDKSLSKHVKDWQHKNVSKELAGTTINGLRTMGVSLTLMPGSGATGGTASLRIEFEDGATFSQGAGRSFRVRNASMTIALEFAVGAGTIELGPVSAKFDGDLYDRAVLAWLYDIIVGGLRKQVRVAVESGITKKLAGDDARRALADASMWLCRLFNGQQLLDMWIEGENLSIATLPKPRKPIPTPVVRQRPTPRWPIEHLVIVMMENRSFTHMLGELMHGSRPDLRLVGNTPMPITDASPTAVGPTNTVKLPFDPPHSNAAQEQNKGGLWTTPCIPREPRTAIREEVLKYQRIAALPVTELFAQHFCVASQWRAALPGHTWPNRLYSLSGSSNGALDNPEGTFDFYDLPTICDVLSAQKVPWRYYKRDVGFIELYRRYTFDNNNVRPYADFEAAVEANQLPAVSWVEPNISDFGEHLGSDDHPPLSVVPGQRFLAGVYAQLRKLANPNWLLVVTYDEHGGFYEEVGPVDAHDDIAACRSTGFRVPAFFVSPLVTAGSVFTAPLDHTSIIRTILDAYCEPDPIFERNARVAAARAFIDLIPSSAAARTSLPDAPVIEEGPVEEGIEGLRTSPEWEAFKAAREGRAAARMQPEGFAAAPTAADVTATLEAIYIVAVSPEARAQIERDVATLDMRARHAFDDPRAMFAEPIEPISIQTAWDRVHALRERRDVVLVDPLWETELGWPVPDSDVIEEAPIDPAWPIKLVRAHEAWQLRAPSGQSRGAGIVIGHLDTGYCDHVELEEGTLQPIYGYNFVDDNADARDPLIAGPLLFPGHGTATASIIASREAGAISGAAPAATLIPYRVSTTVVHLSMKNMVAAIRRAVEFGCHVISISAGGLWSAALHRAVREARDAGVIVVAAAGNYCGFVVWPAQYDEVIACAACNTSETPWRWSSRGPAVDITAPGESVLVADAKGTTRLSSGTSFATAMTSGAIANWLAFHGRDRLIAMYGAHNVTDVVRDLLTKTARPVHGGASGMGPGILDLCGLLEAPLPSPERYPRFVEEAVESPVVDSLGAAGALADQLCVAELTRLPLSARQPLADELLFHKALELARRPSAEPDEEAVSAVPAHASKALADALT